MFTADALRIKTKVEREAVDDPHAVGSERLLNLRSPFVDRYFIRLVKHQHGMHGDRGWRFQLGGLRRHADVSNRTLRGLRFFLFGRWNISAPSGSTCDDGALPRAIHLVAKAAQPVFLVHALAKRLRKCSEP